MPEQLPDLAAAEFVGGFPWAALHDERSGPHCIPDSRIVNERAPQAGTVCLPKNRTVQQITRTGVKTAIDIDKQGFAWIPSSHVAMVSHPDDVAQLIKTAAEAVQAAS